MNQANTQSNDLLAGDIAVTPAAQAKISDLLKDAGEEMQAVRVYVTGGGCSGMNYGMTFADRHREVDSTLTGENGFKLVIDPVAMSYMQGAEIDFIDDGVNATFVFNNVFQAVGGSGACGGCGGSGF